MPDDVELESVVRPMIAVKALRIATNRNKTHAPLAVPETRIDMTGKFI
jgi:hypothetical protein